MPGVATGADGVVVKTCAVLPGRRFAGLGTVLLDCVERNAQSAGFGYAIHALMHERNLSVNGARDAQVIRRYALFSRSLR